ncbi:histidine kinase [Clostridium tertium]|uniref:DUF6199 family natural product biosynthesis protein n=1 Tax=Clostridium TaxID=1485 RepID=UPI002330EAFC|nr:MULTISPECIES: DUF6199 family natural product biosynthesis protein [Clostridium]MDB1923491.1 histidine kinase [Clostridium tertium]MDB1927638.1 histidine kinase [Clostridium tertium]MDB1931264.1 histidine kinase [Clostridium tertium]MDU2158451.1 histidine kinase [Clostridium sp.]MDU6363147.1 histidine kinase [Clostridium sp.]
MFIKIIASIMLLINIFNPRLSWKMSEGWKYKNVKPSDSYLIVNRISSVIVLVIIWLTIPNWI